MTVAHAFSEAWLEAITAYRAGEINSECTLQAFMYMSVRAKLPAYLVLCEPHLPIPASKGFFPDLVVLDASAVLAIAEFKFRPHHYPIYRTDLDKMQMLANVSHPFHIILDSTTGQFTPKTHSIFNNCAFVFAAIGRHDADACDIDALRRQIRHGAERFTFLTYGCGNDA